MTCTLAIETARVFRPLLEPSRYKCAYGGRGSGKSWFFADLMVEDCLRAPGEIGEGMRAICVREVQQDLKDSAKKLLENRLERHGLGESDGFKVYKTEIETPKGGIIIFKGMKEYSAESVKSLEGFRRAWWEEAQTADATSITMLRNTIRLPGSELWFSWNPRSKRDPIETLFRGPPGTQPTGTTIVKANWNDNPWFGETEMPAERQNFIRLQPDQYDNVWEGDYVTIAEGAYYAADLVKAKNDNPCRIGNVARDPLMTIRAIWDIGGTGAKADACAIWICQFVGREIRVLDYYEAQGQPLATHVNWLREKGYGKALCILPHDGATHDAVFDVSYESALRAAEFEVTVIPNQGAGAAKMRIESGHRLFPSIWFNEATTSGGREALGWYHEKKDDARGIGLGPEHDWASHGADAFGLMCVSYEAPQQKRRERDSGIRTGWAG